MPLNIHNMNECYQLKYDLSHNRQQLPCAHNFSKD